MKKPYFRALLGATVVSAFAAMATPAVAQTATGPANPAAGPPSGAACSLNGWAQACFVPAGDVVWVRDARKDGHHADVHFWWGSKPWKPAQTCHDQLGKKAGWTYCSGFPG
ncbi:hypothetical protein [Sciscionella sediminilitoris]|uniref:hypothetical protein n=1 Tax=Sciscionella sediminilitoris TaxID=1445613 RepID=UPI0012E1DD84|nr:hypothetical protein [Sciscionella sp. SE31]